MNAAIKYIKERLLPVYSEREAIAMAKWLLTEVFGFTTLNLYGVHERTLLEQEYIQLDNIINRLKHHEPLQYIIGYEEFCGLRFKVTTHTLIPRPETGELVEWITSDFSTQAPCLLDVGTGSGCIVISIAHKLRQGHYDAIDISADALTVAKENAATHNVCIHFWQQDIFNNWDNNAMYDVIVSNPPYITDSEMSSMEPNVLNWEPHTALFVPDSAPLKFYRRIAEVGLSHLKTNGMLYFEINQRYGVETVSMLSDMGYRNIIIRKDIHQNNRMIRATK